MVVFQSKVLIAFDMKSVGQWAESTCRNFVVIVAAVGLRNWAGSPGGIHIHAEAAVASSLEHLVEDGGVWVLDAGVEVDSSKANVLTLDPSGVSSALELDDPVVLAAIFTLLEADLFYSEVNQDLPFEV